mmetsp:Transcript_39962/g.62344  ORF Transcript_39962/g.62344 Transcript_39962/m.62344 type:complete len:154 (+) Transcript_39962:84-545(+)
MAFRRIAILTCAVALALVSRVSGFSLGSQLALRSASSGLACKSQTAVSTCPISMSYHSATNRRYQGTALHLFGFGKKEEPPQSSQPAKAAGPCGICRDVGAIDCPNCNGTGKDKKGGNVFERWKCMECQGFGQVVCRACSSSAGLTPEQTGER